MSNQEDRDNRKRYKLYRQLSWYRKQASMSSADFMLLAREMYNDLDDAESTSDLSTQALEDLLFGLKTWFAVQSVRNATGVLAVEAQVIVSRINESAEESAERQTRDDSWD